jgi:hypothetical protein
MGHIATTPNRAQPPLTESSGSRHRSPVFHLAAINKRGNIITTETRVDGVQPCFLAHRVVDLLTLGYMLRRAHRLQLRARVRIRVHYIVRHVSMRILSDGVVGTRWRLHVVICVLRRPRIVGVMLVVERWRGLRRRRCGASVWRRERRQRATRRSRSLLVMIYGAKVVQLWLVVVCGSRR